MISTVSTFFGLPIFSLHFLSLNYINRANHGMFLRLELPTQRPFILFSFGSVPAALPLP